VLAVDLGRANLPWVVTWTGSGKYTTNPVIDLLRDKPYEHRVAVLPFPVPQRFTFFSDLYNTEWKQQLFQYYNIQSLDYVMNPRPREDEIAFETALRTRNTNTLYRVTAAGSSPIRGICWVRPCFWTRSIRNSTPSSTGSALREV